jgi:flagellar hook-associated protein 3 FlgL
MLQTLQQNQLAMFLEQNRLATGRRFVTPSENPVAAAQSLNMNEILDQQEQLTTNAQHADDTLSAADFALTEINDLLIEAHSIASQSLGQLSSAEERDASAELISSIIEQLVTVGNREFQGRYLFAGRDNTDQPFVSAMGKTAYLGDTGDVTVRVDDGELEAINVSGDELFNALSGVVTGSVDLNPVISASTRLEDLDGALSLGIRDGQIVINEEGGAGAFQVDLTTADTIGDVVDFINAAAEAAGATVTATLTDVGLQLTPGGSPVSVSDTSAGLVAGDLGILTAPATSAPIVGADLGVRLTATTSVADLAGGAGVDLANGLIITNGAEQVAVDLSDAETVQDVLNKINNAGVHVRARINDAGTGMEVVNLVSGTAMSIGENGGTTAADLGIRSFDTDRLLSDLNFGRGVEFKAGNDDIRITSKDAAAPTVDVNLDGAETVGDVIDLINTAAADAGVDIVASLATTGNGIRIVDNTGGAGSLSVSRLNYSYAIDDLGLNKFVADPATELVSDDTGTVQADSVLTALYDLEAALRGDDEKGISNAAERLNVFMDDVVRIQGIVGARSRTMQDRLTQLENASFATQEFLSQVQDLDYTESVTKFQQAQTALQASMTSGSLLLNLSLMDFL